MNGWELSFDGKSLDDAQKCEVEILNVEDREIIAKVDGFEVVAPSLSLSTSCFLHDGICI